MADRKPGKWLDLNTLSGRYLVVALAVVIVVTLSVGWAVWMLGKATQSSTSSLQLRNNIQSLGTAIRSSVWQTNFALQRYMISPSDDIQKQVLQEIREAREKAAELAKIQSGSQGSAEKAIQLKEKLGKLQLQLDHLMEIRNDPQQLHPAMHLMSGFMLPANDAFVTAVNLALSELVSDNSNILASQEFLLLNGVRDRWRQMIGFYRVMVANRFGAFTASQEGMARQSYNVRLLYQQIRENLRQLTKMDVSGDLGFQTSDALAVMRLNSENWYEYFQKVSAMYSSDDWRTDLPFLRDIVQPLFDNIWQALLAVELAVEKKSNQQVDQLRTAGRTVSVTLWVLAGLLFVLVISGYTVLDRILLGPIARISHALSLDVDVKSDRPFEVPEARTREIQQLVTAFENMRSDVQRRRLALEYQSLHDSLTGLPNRAYLLEELTETLKKASRLDRNVGLMIMDLDHFKEINDTLGHPVGDLILQAVSKRLSEAIGDCGLTARLGGDEFAVILQCTNQGDCARTSVAIARALEKEFQVGGHKLYVGGSVGVAIYPKDGIDVSVLMRHADVAMYTAKHTGKRTVFYDDTQDENSLLRLQLVKDLKDAISNDHLDLHFQPKINLVNQSVSSVEALLRWEHPEHGMVPPGRIIPMAEQTGVIQQLTRWVLARALRQLSDWRRDGIDIGVAVNLSAYDLRDTTLPEVVHGLLTETGTHPEQLTLEVTESAMMSDLNNAAQLLSRIKEMGVSIAIDDFGTGFSSLSYLKKLPVKELKIDKSFVINMGHDENDAMIVHSTIDLAHNLGLTVVAEGVESRKVLEQLQSQGCDLVQGFHVCKPLPAVKLGGWLREMSHRVTALHKAGDVA
ncbi:diguanylate cyclase (GGDEF)-like protein [Thiogranum longum]|uniref:cyclic-guanylate-specific phosphodiesterase n=1 Tax=Thiogranum longum TaxID=1537524 RepID=A0A4R1H6P9_9GAMM|nr:GGDEF domain-containing phosphodiesterase [Thiogranum longum]TCK17437.1 diguanylate cyclase (GGDEF)-like protein [Thiogranum longum]